MESLRAMGPETAVHALSGLRTARGYLPHLEVVPDSANVSVAANSTYEHRVTIPVGSLLWGLSGSSSQADGFRVQIIDTNVKVSTRSTSALLTFRGVPGRGSPTIHPVGRSTKRCRHLHTVWLLTWICWATTVLVLPSAHKRIMRDRNAKD